jgi:4-amino-4-deoxy-L-arabinose transferase-like glycosyltransferase
MSTTIVTPPAAGRPDPADPAGELDWIDERSGRDGPGPVPRAAPGWGRRLVRGKETDPVWVRPALFALLAATAVLYLWDLGASGWGNSFYSAAVQAGTKSWKAMFFGSSDSSNFITVDKPPAALWIVELSARMFGLSSWSVLAPQALEGVAAVGVLYATIRRWFSPAAALLAGAVLALTPVATLMFRFNNPDSLLVLLLVAAGWATVRAVESGRTRWLVLMSVFVGFAFNAKMLQAFVVVPVFAGVYLLAGPPKFWRRFVQLIWAGVALVVSSGWWVAAVMLTPAADRPYIGGSQDNNLLNLIFGYNGLGRLSGNESGSVVGGGATGQSGMWGPTGWSRMFNSEFGGQIAWLIPAALIFLGAGLWWTRRAPRTDRTRAALLIWGGWLLVTAATFSFAAGIIHPYYTVALAPAIGALVGIGAVACWRGRRSLVARSVLGAALAATSLWAWVLLGRSPSWLPWLRGPLLVVGLVTAVALVLPTRLNRAAGAALAAFGLVVALAAPAASSLETATTAHTGAIPSAGPTVVGARGGPGGAGGFRGAGAFGGTPPAGATGAVPSFPPGGANATGGFTPPTGAIGNALGGHAGGVGGLLDSGSTSAALKTALQKDASAYRWVAATVGSNSAAGLQLSTGDPVMAIGGFNGTDPAPSLATFESYVKSGLIHYFVPGGGGASGAGGSPTTTSVSSRIASWVESHYTATTIGGTTVYDLTQG